MSAPLVQSTLPNLLAFCSTYENGSFTGAARALRLTPAAVSRSVARLEESLGASLFRRTTRALRPTPTGEAYYAKCAEALRLLSEAERELTDRKGAPSGLVRISAPTTYGLHHLLPGLGDLRARHPGIELEVEISNLNADFVRGGFDLAIRLGTVDDPGIVARKLGDFPVGVFASPRYLGLHGTPRTPDELAEHETIAFVMPRTGRILPWIFAAPNQEWLPASRLRCTTDPRATLLLAEAGAGIAQGFRFLAEEAIARGTLVEILGAHGGRTRRFSLLYPREGAARPAVRAVIDAIVASRRPPLEVTVVHDG